MSEQLLALDILSASGTMTVCNGSTQKAIGLPSPCQLISDNLEPHTNQCAKAGLWASMNSIINADIRGPGPVPLSVESTACHMQKPKQQTASDETYQSSLVEANKKLQQTEQTSIQDQDS